jgi:alkanesulfonate monooxygenase SsuD/methylene tetrahydromethanopterin reductase-like flavin-dependent oxidoreductase (luciferase family)
MPDVTPEPPRLKLGFLTNVPFSSGPGGAARGLRETIGLFEHAEALGYDSGWVRQRHFDNYLPSPLPMLAAVAVRTARIRLGIAIVAIRYEDPIRLAEDAATVDLLSDGRLELGISGGTPHFEDIFGASELSFTDESQSRLQRFREAISGQVIGSVTPPGQPAQDLIVRPNSPGLPDRIWYGAATIASAERTARQGLDLLVSTVNTQAAGLPFDQTQLEYILAYKAAYGVTHPGSVEPRISVSRVFLPAVNKRQRARYAEYNDIREREGAAGPRPDGALAPGTLVPTPTATNGPPKSFQLSPVPHGDPHKVVEELAADVALAEGQELVIFLPPNFTFDEYRELLDNVAEHVAGELGWSPAKPTD